MYVFPFVPSFDSEYTNLFDSFATGLVIPAFPVQSHWNVLPGLRPQILQMPKKPKTMASESKKMQKLGKSR